MKEIERFVCWDCPWHESEPCILEHPPVMDNRSSGKVPTCCPYGGIKCSWKQVIEEARK